MRYRSTGQEVPLPATELTPERIRELRAAGKNPRNEAAEAIAQRHEERMQKQAAGAHDEAVSYFDEAYKDLTSQPTLLRDVVLERQRRINDAMEKRQSIDDWHSFYSQIGEDVRKRAGLPTSAERERIESLEMVRKAREHRGE